MSEEKVNLSPDDIELIKKNFNELNIDNEAGLDRKTVSEILNSEGSQLECLMVALMFERYDMDRNGLIDFNEFIIFCQEMNGLTAIDILHLIFDEADKDKNGYLDTDEVIRLGKLMGLNIRRNDARATIKVLDTNNDNMIDFNEFCAILSE